MTGCPKCGAVCICDAVANVRAHERRRVMEELVDVFHKAAVIAYDSAGRFDRESLACQRCLDLAHAHEQAISVIDAWWRGGRARRAK